MLGWWRRLRRRRFQQATFPQQWLVYLQEEAPFYAQLSPQQQFKLQRHILAFVDEKVFIGAQGFEITPRVQVVIAAAAGRLVLGLNMSFYDRLTEIVVYAGDYTHADKDGIVMGEAHTWGTVVLSWDAVQRGLQNPDDGHDTALHEFAHVLDVAGGSFDGTPRLRADEHYRVWGEVMSEHFLRLRKRGPHRRALLRQYGATNEAEFFAVATEAFFEKPEQMQDKAPQLFEELSRFYGLRPS